MKRSTGTKKVPSAVKVRCEKVKRAISHAEGCTPRVKQMLGNTLLLTIGTNKADRHPFNERFVAMVEQVLEAERARLIAEVSSKEAAFEALTPAKATREQALTPAKATR